MHESSQGTVFLKEFPDASIRASHPATVHPDLMRRILTGVHAREQKTMIESTLTGDVKSMPVFTLSEASFLAPLLSSALSQATAEEEVRFRINSSMSGKRLGTEGAVYATGESLNLSLTEFGLTPQRPGTLSQPSRSFDRAKRWTLTFRPEAVVVNWKTETQVSAEGAEPNVLTISLDSLARYPDPTTRSRSDLDRTGGPAAAREERDPTREEMEEELRRLRGTIEQQEKRLDQMERQLEKR